MDSRPFLFCTFVFTTPALAWAQGSPFQTPGMPQQTYGDKGSGASNQGDMSQANRFSSVFNPAFSFVGDFIVDYQNNDAGENGWKGELRTLEMAAQAWVDPTAWAYFVAATDGETLNVEEAAVHYKGLGGNNTIRAGRFFIDFGKQMQTHVHELRTIERPLVLRTFLGEEVKGEGLQWDDWTSVGDATAVRWSIGAFSNLLPETPEDFDPNTQAAISIADRKSAGDLNFTARLTGFTDVGSNGTLQVGASARVIPNYTLEFAPSGNSVTDLNNTVYGADITYGWKSDTGVNALTVGGEYLLSTGDAAHSITDVGGDGDPTNDTIATSSDKLHGWFAFADYFLDQNNSVGVQYSEAELPDGSATKAREYVAYYTHSISEFHRLRISFSRDDVEGQDDSFRGALEYTFIVGAHGHGVNW